MGVDQCSLESNGSCKSNYEEKLPECMLLMTIAIFLILLGRHKQMQQKRHVQQETGAVTELILSGLISLPVIKCLLYLCHLQQLLMKKLVMWRFFRPRLAYIFARIILRVSPHHF